MSDKSSRVSKETRRQREKKDKEPQTVEVYSCLMNPFRKGRV